MDVDTPAVPREVRAALEGYLEVLNFASDPAFLWTIPDLHAAFQWTQTLDTMSSNSQLAACVQSEAQVRHLASSRHLLSPPAPTARRCATQKSNRHRLSHLCRPSDLGYPPHCKHA